MNDDSLKILAPSLLVKTYLSTQDQSHLLNETIKNVLGKDYNLSFYLEDELDETISKPTKKISSNVMPIENVNYFSNCKLNSKYIFDSFVVGPCNKEAATAALMVANDPGKLFNPLFIYSKSGLGKTHLLHAIGNYYQEKHPNAHALVNNGKQIVLTSDRHPRDLKDLEDRLVSRFNMGLSVNIQNPDTDTLLEILKKKIQSRGLNIDNYDEDGLKFLAETFSKNVRELEGALNRLLFHTVSLKDDEQISLQEIQEAVNIMMPKNDKKKLITAQDIVEQVAKYYSISEEQIMSPIRNAQIALARRISMYLCRSLLGMSFIQIGQFFKRDHSTVITGVDKVGREIKTDNQLASAILDLKKALKK